MASDPSIFKDRDAAPEEESTKHVRNTDISLFLRNREEDKASEDKPKETEAKKERSDDPGLLPSLGLLAIPGVGPLLAAAAMVTHEHDLKEKKEESDDKSDETIRLTEDHAKHKSDKTED